MTYQYDFTIAEISIQIRSETKLRTDEKDEPFMIKTKDVPDIIYEIQLGDVRPEDDQKTLLYSGKRFRVREDDTYRYRIYPYNCADSGKYMTLRRKRTNEADVQLKETEIWQLRVPFDAEYLIQYPDQRIVHMALEEMLYPRGRILLHASYVETPKGAILFTGSSGIGKSTQGKLWEQYGGGTVMNGDRTVLYEREDKEGKRIIASGSPCAGSSGIYRNYQSVVRAIVVLSQGEENQIELLGGWKGLVPLVKESNYAFMDEIMKKQQMELLCSVAERIPIYHYRCRKDKSAVEMLQAVLDGKL